MNNHRALLLSTRVPIPKTKRGIKCNANMYSEKTIGIILVKIFDIIVLVAHYDSLLTNVYNCVRIHVQLFVLFF